MNGAPTEKLLGGITIADAVAQAERWWDARGRFMVHGRMTDVQHVASFYSPASAGYVRREHERDHEAGGILNGWTWDLLTKQERLAVVRSWHENHWLPRERPDLVKARPAEGRRIITTPHRRSTRRH